MFIPFYKYHGNGNDFIILLSKDIPADLFDKKFIIQACDRNFGIGADGLFIISESLNYDFFLDYYNADGSWETLCANGSRCVIHFMHYYNDYKSTMTFEAGDGIHIGSILSANIISMSLKIPKYKSKLINIYGLKGYFIDSGAKHFVCKTENLSDDFVLRLGKKIRYSKEFQPYGVNVNFYNYIADQPLTIKTYEKGVEKIMMSCASGSAAVVFHIATTKKLTSPVITESKGGTLKYTFNKNWTKFNSEGPAYYIFSGKYNL